MLMGSWIAQLIKSDAYYVCYVLLGIIISICTYINITNGEVLFRNKHGRYIDVVINVFSVFFSCMVAFANYKIIAYTVIPEGYGITFDRLFVTLMTIIFFAGGYCAFWNVFILTYNKLTLICWKKRNEKLVNPTVCFWVSFILLVLSRVIVLYFSQYPGELTSDSITQVIQTKSGIYTNHHPFYHTMVIKLFMDLGMMLFNDINAAVATYSFFQILSTAFCFSFAVSTITRMGLPIESIIMIMMFFLLMPYHIMYAFTMWKDVMFGCFVLLLVTSIFRCMNNIGNNIINYIMLFISGIGTCLFRSNGFFAFIILTVLFWVLFGKKEIRIFLMFVVMILICFTLKHPVLKALKVAQPDTIESLSIPAQQIARVVYEGYELTESETILLRQVMDIDQIPDTYNAHISDPIKALVRTTGNQQLIEDNKFEYIKLYIMLGLKYPFAYARGWIDETRGYWNAGYEYWIWSNDVHEDNAFGIKRITNSDSFNRRLNEYLWLFRNVEILKLFLCIGLFIWVDIYMLIISLLRKDREGILASLPIFVVVCSLLVATPVFSEFRYIYAAFCTLPMVVVIALRPIEGKEDETRNG